MKPPTDHRRMDETAPKPPLWGRNFILVCLCNTAVFMGFQMLLPTLPVYVQELGGTPATMGLVMGIFTFPAVAVRPLVGRALDTVGRRGIFLFGLAVFVVSVLAYRWATSVPMLLALRVVHGFGWGFSTTAASTIASDVIPPSRLGEGMGYFNLASTIAMVIAPALGLFIIQRFDFPFLFYLSGALAFLALALGWAIRSAQQSPTEPGGKATRAKGALFEPRALRPALVMLLSNTIYGATVTFIAPYATQQGIANFGLFFTFFAIVLAASRPIAGILADRRGDNAVVITGLILSAGAMVLLSRADSLWMFLLTGVVYGMGFGAVQPSMQALAVRGVPPNRRGAANSTLFIGFDLGIGIGAMLWGGISQATGYERMYLLAAIPAGLALVAYLITGRRRERGPSTA